jgi:polysaccharide export outer membrane protein
MGVLGDEGMRFREFAFRGFAFLAFSLLMACDVTKSEFPVKNRAVQQETQELSKDVTVVVLDASNIDQYTVDRESLGAKSTLPPSGGWDYRVGVGDTLDVIVWDHQELNLPAGQRTAAESGLRVQSDGTFFYPFVGQVDAKGLTPEVIRENLTQKLSTYIPNPQIQVRVVGYNSQFISVTGQVKAPNRRALAAQPVTLLESIDASGGLTETADPSEVTVRRGGKIYHVNLQAFLENGDSAFNPVLTHGDVVNVPRLEKEQAYLLGQIVAPSTIKLTKTNESLTSALTSVGGLREDQADARGVFVFRSKGDGIEVYQLDVSNPAAFLLGTKFSILPDDVIYVTTAPLYRWNRLISSLVPTISAARTVDPAN